MKDRRSPLWFLTIIDHAGETARARTYSASIDRGRRSKCVRCAHVHSQSCVTCKRSQVRPHRGPSKDSRRNGRWYERADQWDVKGMTKGEQGRNGVWKTESQIERKKYIYLRSICTIKYGMKKNWKVSIYTGNMAFASELRAEKTERRGLSDKW